MARRQAATKARTMTSHTRVRRPRVALANEATDPKAPAAASGAIERENDITEESPAPAADHRRGGSFSHGGRRRAVLLAFACVGALLVGFGSVTAVLSLRDQPPASETKPRPTTAVSVRPPPPSASLPAVTTGAASTATGLDVGTELPSPAQDPLPAPAPAQDPLPAPAPVPSGATSQVPEPPTSSAPANDEKPKPETPAPDHGSGQG
jgi:hypothetical protein